MQIKTPFEQAERDGAGQKLVNKAKEDILKRRESSNKDTYQAAKEAAHYLAGQARGRVKVGLNFSNDKAMNYERVFGHS
jgi:hypothetical protein